MPIPLNCTQVAAITAKIISGQDLDKIQMKSQDWAKITTWEKALAPKIVLF